MHTPTRLVACPACACHFRAEEPECPHCGSARAGRPQAALMLGLVLLGGCGKSVAMYGTPVTGTYVSVTITSPVEAALIEAPGDLTVEATVSATEAMDLATVDVAWSVDDVAACDDATVSETGETTCTVPLAAGEHAISVEITDPATGRMDGATVVVTVGEGS